MWLEPVSWIQFNALRHFCFEPGPQLMGKFLEESSVESWAGKPAQLPPCMRDGGYLAFACLKHWLVNHQSQSPFCSKRSGGHSFHLLSSIFNLLNCAPLLFLRSQIPPRREQDGEIFEVCGGGVCSHRCGDTGGSPNSKLEWGAEAGPPEGGAYWKPESRF